MNLELYRIFCCVAATGNILKASDQLYISQPAVSRAIMQLENDIGCKLFIRSSRGVKLTSQGEILHRYAQQALSFLRTGEKKVFEYENLEYGEVIIGISDTLCRYYLTPYLSIFNNKYPNIKINIKWHNTPETMKQLKEGMVDLAIVTTPLKEENITLLPVLELQDCFVAGEKYKALSQKKHHLSELTSYPLLLLTDISNSRLFADDFFKRNSVEYTPAFEISNFDLLFHFARNNFGIAFVIKNFVQDDLAQGKLYEIELYEKIPLRNACIAMTTEPSPAAKELIGMMSPN